MLEAAYVMLKYAPRRRLTAALCTAAIALSTRAQAPAENIVTRVTAEVFARPAQPGGDTKLQAAQRVVPGDVLIYTVEVRNTARYAAESAVVVQPIPNHTMYIADSAVGPGVEVDYSIDGGSTFDKPENLKAMKGAGAVARGRGARAAAADYTHIRWRLQNRLKPHSIAYVRFRAQVK